MKYFYYTINSVNHYFVYWPLYPFHPHLACAVERADSHICCCVLLHSFEEQAVFVNVKPSLTSWRAALTTTNQRQQPCNHLLQ